MSSAERIDFGNGCVGYWLGWSPDRDIESNRVRYEGIADLEKCSLVLDHAKPDGSLCQGVVTVDQPGARQVFPAPHPLWQVKTWEPLTLTPSVLCGCGWHGFITDGKWVPC